ncbi:hypothetical protein PHMEG_0007418 [Phytophthora megakarya]|uniref:Ty3 transposon capsid-like protein domain-containing protein n=1 Tax=Phytophthora megakarya TaxID=4795 RepID=A0A225WLP8_9STRA|nr:hypothetical protein PHMEG_0007418 [Phytophthora megakarya]
MQTVGWAWTAARLYLRHDFANLSPTAKTWFRDCKMSLGNQSATWVIFKAKIRGRFRDSDFEHKVLSNMHQLRCTGSQQRYTTQFLHLLSQLDQDVPEFVKRWQHLPEDVRGIVSQHVPKTLTDVFELSHRYTASRPSKNQSTSFTNRKGNGIAKPSNSNRSPDSSIKSSVPPNSSGGHTSTEFSGRVYVYCSKPGHTHTVCRKLKTDERVKQQKLDAGPRGTPGTPADVPSPTRARVLRDGPAPLVDRDGNVRRIVGAILDHDDSPSCRSARRSDGNIPSHHRYLVRWIGLLDDSSEPRSILLKDVPGLVEAYESALSADRR